MTEPALTIEMYWEKRQTDVSKCRACREPIYSDMFVAILATPKKETVIAKVCESCFTEMNIEEWRQE